VVVVPATTKGWIDRVWNNGWAYGDRKLPHQSALLIGAASGDAAGYAKRRYDEAMRIQLVTGIMEYCGIPRAELALLYDVMGGAAARQGHLETVRALGATWFR
jgi:NAD(P)H dehydrogenase (quinone)